MPLFLLIILTLTSLSFAGVSRVDIQGLNFDYLQGEGEGSAQKVKLSFSLMAPGPYLLQVKRTANSFELLSEFLDVTWENPWSFIHDLESANIKNASIGIGGRTHFVESEGLTFQVKDEGPYEVKNLVGNCEGTGDGDFDVALVDDCRTKMDLKMSKLDIPTGSLLHKILHDLPVIPSDRDVPADNLKFSSRNGDFKLIFYLDHILPVAIRTRGHFHFENKHQTVVIRVDQIKYGQLSVTGFMMRRLKDLIKSPNVKVDPPYIRIEIGNKNEK